MTMRKWRAAIALGAAICLAAVTAAIAAADWQVYVNERFGYQVDIPPGFSEIEEADNGDGGVSRSEDGTAEIKVWSGHLMMTDIDANKVTAEQVLNDEVAGPGSYESVDADGASRSGSSDDRIFYYRAILPCGGIGAILQIEYPKDKKEFFDPIVTRMVRSFKPVMTDMVRTYTSYDRCKDK